MRQWLEKLLHYRGMTFRHVVVGQEAGAPARQSIALNPSVVPLIQVLDRDPSKQRLYHDPGVGTLTESGVSMAMGKKISEWFGLTFGGGLTCKVEEAYFYLMEYWSRAIVCSCFGFSRRPKRRECRLACVVAARQSELGTLGDAAVRLEKIED
jgi:hypothetical protein